MVPQSMRLKYGHLPVLGLASIMIAKGPPLDHVSRGQMGLDLGVCVLWAAGQ